MKHATVYDTVFFIPVSSDMTFLADSHSNALNQNVELRLFFGNHGSAEQIPDHGRAVLRSTESDYRRVAALVDMLDPIRGDQLACELAGHTPGDSESDLRYLKDRLSDSPYASQARATAFSVDAPLEDRLASLDTLRQKRLIAPYEYALFRADANGIPIHFADAPESEYYATKAELQAKYSEGFAAHNPIAFIKYERELTRYREPHMVRRLGEIASSALPQDTSVPILGYLVGQTHKRSIQRILGDHTVRYRSYSYSPDSGVRDIVGFAVALCGAHGLVEAHRKRQWIQRVQQSP